MNLSVFVLAAALLSLERICYAHIWNFPESFRSICERPPLAYLGEPIQVLEKLFYCFKGIQVTVFIGWCYFYGDGSLLPLSGVGFWIGLTLIVVGQILNLSVFYRLGKIGVFYGNKLGYEILWCRKFPFSFLAHPQYVGALLSIWGFFFVMRFPHADWYILPILQTAYYSLGAFFEK